jgi:hypothetical protein
VAALQYTTATAIKAQADITDSNDDARLGAVATAVNELVEGYIGLPVGDGGTAVRTFDIPARTKTLHIRGGVQGVTTLEYAGSTSEAKASTYTEITSSNYVLRPAQHDLPTGWPYFDIELVDGSTPGSFPVGYDIVKVTPSGGWG